LPVRNEFLRKRQARDVEVGGREAIEPARGAEQRVAVAKMDDAEDRIVGKRIRLRLREAQTAMEAL